MDFKDYYATLGLTRTATQDEIKRAYRKLARKYHPDVSKEPDAESQFKNVAEAYEALNDLERRAAYDDAGKRHQSGQSFDPPPGWDSGFEFTGRDFGVGEGSEHSDFFESLFRRQRAGRRGPRPAGDQPGDDHHAKVQIALRDSYQGAQRSISLRVPQLDASGLLTMQDRRLDVNIPRGIRAGQHLRLQGQGSPGNGAGKAGDLYLEIEFELHPQFRVDGLDVHVDVPVAPWEAALGASIAMTTPDGQVQLSVPAGSLPGRKLRLKGKGIPAVPPGNLYAVLSIALPPAVTDPAREAYRVMAKAFEGFNPREPPATTGA